MKGYDDNHKPFIVVDNTKNSIKENSFQQEKIITINQKSQKEKIKNVNSIRPKGDIELKNIQYRFSDHRYIGRKQINGNIITVYAKTQKECQKKLKDSIKNIKLNTHTKKKQTTFLEYWNKWYEENKKPFITKETQSQIERVKNKIVSIHNLPITKIDKDTILKLLKTFPNGRAKEKIELYIKACFKSAFFDGLIKSNPFNNIVLNVRINKHKPAFTYEQQVKILERLQNEEIKPIILIYLITGLRRREFDYINIDKNLSEDEFILKALNLKGRNFVTRYKNIQLSKAGFKLIKDNIELIKTWSDEKVYRKFAEILKELDIKGSIVNLRHTFATNNFYLGNPELFISRQMGHSSSQITKDNYTDIDYHLNKEKILKLYNNLYYIF